MLAGDDHRRGTESVTREDGGDATAFSELDQQEILASGFAYARLRDAELDTRHGVQAARIGRAQIDRHRHHTLAVCRTRRSDTVKGKECVGVVAPTHS